MFPLKSAAIILAAGYSSRMDAFKPLLPIMGQPAVAWAVRSMQFGGVTDIGVVTGHRAWELESVLLSLGVTPVFNENYAQGMFSSVLAGLATVDDDVDGVFLLPGDMPLVKPTTIAQLMQAGQKSAAPVTYPCFLGRRGHPPFISRTCFAHLRAQGADGQLRLVLEKLNGQAGELPVIDQGIGLDLDTPCDYQKARVRTERNHIPTWSECWALWDMYKTPEQVILHGYRVALAALVMARALNQRGFTLDLTLVRAGGLLHDLAKGHLGHAAQGADWLVGHGFSAVAELVRRHQDLLPAGLDLPAADLRLDEKALVYLADKMVQGEKIIPAAEKFAAVAQNHSGDPLTVKQISRRLQHAHQVEYKVQAFLAKPDLCGFVQDRCARENLTLDEEFDEL